ncbi:hypothetical protein RIF29_40304 [Crotalaria pallida]|uniref:Uncharacterized protein n=1 Tax=Crotalaria pallida TaxID=3830 RepID=A0AAN9E2X5_CROPI
MKSKKKLAKIVQFLQAPVLWNLSVLQRLREIGGLGSGEGVEIVLELALVVVAVVDGVDGFLVGVGVGVDGKVDGAQSAPKRTLVEDDGVAGTDVVLAVLRLANQ